MTKKIIGTIVILVIGVAIGLVSFGRKETPAPAPAPKPVGATVENFPTQYVNGIALGQTGNGLLENAVELSIPLRSNQASWKNTTGNTVYVWYSRAAMNDSAVASTSLALTMGTSTTATITDSATPLYGSLIDGKLIATSTKAAALVANSIKDGGTNGRGVIPVLNNEYLIAVLENPYVQGCTGSVCEQATSTNRGYSLNIAAKYSQ